MSAGKAPAHLGGTAKRVESTLKRVFGVADKRRWEIGVLVGPCDEEDAEWLMGKVFDVVQGRLGAVVSLGPWEDEEIKGDAA